MAIGAAYATAQQYRQLIDKIDSGDNAAIDAGLLAVSRWLDRSLGRFFTKDAAPVARDYRLRTMAYELLVNDMSAAPTLVKVDDDNDGTPEITLASGTDYVLEPSGAALGPEPAPYRKLVIPAWSPRGPFLAGQLVRVTAAWGWPAVPEAIVQATVHLTALLRLETPRAESTVTEMGSVISMSPQARGIVERLAQEYSRRAMAV